MRVAEKSDAIGGQSDDLIDGVGKSVRRLVGKTVNQINDDAIKAEFARGKEEVARAFMRLDAVDRLLHVGMEILNTHAEAIEPQLAERFKMRNGGHPRVDLDANLAVRIEVGMLYRRD